jgi:hypothetical protein
MCENISSSSQQQQMICASQNAKFVATRYDQGILQSCIRQDNSPVLSTRAVVTQKNLSPEEQHDTPRFSALAAVICRPPPASQAMKKETHMSPHFSVLTLQRSWTNSPVCSACISY